MMSFCVVPCRADAGDAVLLGGDDVQRQQPGRRRVDRHRRVHLAERDAVQQLVHVALVGDRHADLADLAARELVVGVVAGLGRQVERDRQARLALGQVGPVELVGLLRGRVARVGPHHPRAVALGKPVFHALNRTVRSAIRATQAGSSGACWTLDLAAAPRARRSATASAGARDPLVPPRRRCSSSATPLDFAATGDEFLGHFRALAGLQPTERVLDVGCGIGRMARPLAGFLDRRQGSYEGFDVDRDGIALVRRALRRATPTSRFPRADLFNARYNPAARAPRAASTASPTTTRSFDLVIATSVYHAPARGRGRRTTWPRSRARPAPGGRLFATFFLLDDASRAADRRRRTARSPFLDPERARRGASARTCPRRPSPTTRLAGERAAAPRPRRSTTCSPARGAAREAA